MSEDEKREDYVVKSDEAAIVLKPDGQVDILMPNTDGDEFGTISEDSPTFRAMVIMTFIRNDKVREQITQELVEQYFKKQNESE